MCHQLNSTSLTSYRYWPSNSHLAPVDDATTNWSRTTLYISDGGTASWCVDLSPNLPKPDGTYGVCLDIEILNVSIPPESTSICASLECAGDQLSTPAP